MNLVVMSAVIVKRKWRNSVGRYGSPLPSPPLPSPPLPSPPLPSPPLPSPPLPSPPLPSPPLPSLPPLPLPPSLTSFSLQSLSREERKTEQVWRVFEKMEASAQRKRQQLLSEGSHDSDPLSSPTPLHPLSSRVLKDRHLSSSSSSRKAQLLPVGKM